MVYRWCWWIPSTCGTCLLNASCMLLGTSLVELVLRLLRVSCCLCLGLLGVVLTASVFAFECFGIVRQNFMNSLVLGLIGRAGHALTCCLHHLVHDDVACSLNSQVFVGTLRISAYICYNFRKSHCLLSVVARCLCVIYCFLDLVLLELNIWLVHHLILSGKKRLLCALRLSLSRQLEHSLVISKSLEVVSAGSLSLVRSILLSDAIVLLIRLVLV